MEAEQQIKVEYDVVSRRVVVTYGERRVRMPGTYETIDEARSAAEIYAKRYLVKK